ncbi:MAG: 3-methyladenine DNA glycosylase AlkC [Myxococcota bacterium]|jgi:3-methyladenine DNA glycosylase AlkC
MPEPFKNFISPASMAQLADGLFTGTPTFPRDAFLAAAIDGLEPLELKARVRHVARALHASLPKDWDTALAVLLAGMGPPLPDDTEVSAGFRYWPVLTVVEEYGLAHPAASLAALKEMTKRFSAEFAVRPYLIAHPDLAFSTLTRWCDDSDVHVRRLVSEGSRPRLPWGQQLPASIADPSRGIVLLERLVDAPERYVQRSVANHLNDIAKDHPDRAAKLASDWSAVVGRAWTVRHGLRTLLKQGHAGALAVEGYGPLVGTASGVCASPKVVVLGGSVRVSARIVSTSKTPQKLMVDVVVGLVKKNGTRSGKVFKGAKKVLAAGEVWAFEKVIGLKKVTTRRYYSGVHAVGVQVNGTVVGTAEFELKV